MWRGRNDYLDRNTMPLLKLERISKLGRLGEELVAERLRHHGYTHMANKHMSWLMAPEGKQLGSPLGR
jgi:hypothetical protein